MGRTGSVRICQGNGYKKVLLYSRNSTRVDILLPNKGRRKRRTSLAKADITKLLNEGERLVGAYALVRSGPPQSTKYVPSFEYFLFVSLTGIRGFFPVVDHDGKEQRVFRSVDRILRMLRELGYLGPIAIYDETDPRRPKATGATRRRPGEKLAAFSSPKETAEAV